MAVDSIGSSASSVHHSPREIKDFFLSDPSFFSAAPQIVVGFISRIFFEKVPYEVKGEIVSPATKVIFTRSKHTYGRICLKIWLRWQDKLYDTSDITTCAEYLVDGLKFNRRFAPHVYLGIAPVELDRESVLRGRLIPNPEKSMLKHGVEYALVMKYLEPTEQLDYLLQTGVLNTEADMAFLARKVARMHRQLEPSPASIGDYACISSKLSLNVHLFNEALNQFDPRGVEKYRPIGEWMTQACKDNYEAFDKRYRDGRIKRCHGDLKATNLWVAPEKPQFFGMKRGGRELLALDCVDFNHPEFCHIDTLSDVAMLAADIEMRLNSSIGARTNNFPDPGLARYFLDVYLQELQEDREAVWPLLEYYMTEKAMVCAYMSILYDQAPDLGRSYFEIALDHAQRLANAMC